MREAFVGFDSAWGGKVPGGIAWVTFVADGLDSCVEPKLARFDDAAQIIEELRSDHDYVLVALDQPTLVPNEKDMRPVERVAGSLIGKLGSYVLPANRNNSKMFGPTAPIWPFLDRIGARENPPAARDAREGLHLIEVFPALALTALEPAIMKRKKAARYNPAKKFSLTDWHLVANAVARQAKDVSASAAVAVGRDGGGARLAQEERSGPARRGDLPYRRAAMAPGST